MHRSKSHTATPKPGPTGKRSGSTAVRAAHRPADGHPRHHGGEHRAAEPRRRPEPDRLEHQLDDHELLADLRQPAALRRPRRRPARTPPDVPDRPRHLHRILVRLCDGPHRRRTSSPLEQARVSALRCSPRQRSRSSCRPSRAPSGPRLWPRGELSEAQGQRSASSSAES